MKNLLQIILLLCFGFVSFETFASKVEKIIISGNSRVETSTIEEYLGIDVGDEYSEEAKSKAVKSLYATSFFEKISMNYDNGILKLNVVENYFISDVEFVGNRKIKKDMFEKYISTSVGESLKIYKVNADVKKIKEMYQKSGRFSAIVTSKIEKLSNNRVRVVFTIDEGPKTGVKNIYFKGNKHYSDSELKSIIMTRESRWFRFLSSDDSYDPARIEHDKELLKQFYGSVGFADFRVMSVTAELLPTKEGFDIVYSLEEGKKYNFGTVKLQNELSSISDKELEKFIYVHKDGLFNLSDVQKSVDEIGEFLSDKGFPNANVVPDLKLNLEKNAVDVTFHINKLTKQYINRINITGNLKTEENVIRRELKIDEGDVFNRARIQSGIRNIKNLNYFSDDLSVNWVPSEHPNQYDLNIDVEEKSTSSFGMEFGYDTNGGPFSRLSFTERNLIGTGRSFNTGVRAGKKSMYYYAGMLDPHFMDSDFAFGLDAFISDNSSGSGFTSVEQKNYSSTSTGGSVSLGYELADDLYHKLEYGLTQDYLKSDISNPSVYIQEQMGTYNTSWIGQTLTYDQTDNRFLSKNGYLLSLNQEYAGLGGNVDFIKNELSSKFFKSFVNNKYTLSFLASGGIINGVDGDDVRISDRFNLGAEKLRGFAQSGIGPRVKTTGESLGGQKYYRFVTELSFPLYLMPKEFNVSGSVFIDSGSLWDADSQVDSGIYNSKSLRSSVGFGFLWVTRMAPIRVDFGFPIKKKDFDETQIFNIRFTTEL